MEEEKEKRIEKNWIHKDDEIRINGVVIDLTKSLNQEWNFLQIISNNPVPKQDYIEPEPELSWSDSYYDDINLKEE